MTRILLIFVIHLAMAFALLTPVLHYESTIVRGQIITVPQPENGTKLLFNMKDHVSTLVNATTNETISVSNFVYRGANESTNEMTMGDGNISTNGTSIRSSGNMSTITNITK